LRPQQTLQIAFAPADLDPALGASPCHKTPLKTKNPFDSSTSTATIPVCLSAPVIRGALPLLSSPQAARNGESATVNLPFDWSLPLIAVAQVVLVDVSMPVRNPAIRSRSSCVRPLTGPAGLAH
jgi:hypothetical protein